MIEFANPFVVFEIAGITMFLAFIALLVCVASWVYTDAKTRGISKWWSVVAIILPFLLEFCLYMIRRSNKKIEGEHTMNAVKTKDNISCHICKCDVCITERFCFSSNVR